MIALLAAVALAPLALPSFLTSEPDGLVRPPTEKAPSPPDEASEEKPPPASVVFFSEPRLLRLEITVSSREREKLDRRPREYVRATIRESTPEGVRVYEDVGLHLKGQAGSFQNFDAKPALTLNFDKFVKKLSLIHI